MRPDCSKRIRDQNKSARLQEMLRNHHVGCCGLMCTSGHDKTTLQQPQQRHSKQTHRHEVALCHDVTLDMIHPWVPFITPTTNGCPKGEAVGGSPTRATLHIEPNAVLTDVSPLRNHQTVTGPLVAQLHIHGVDVLRIPFHRQRCRQSSRAVESGWRSREFARQSTRQCRPRKRSALTELEAVPAVTQS